MESPVILVPAMLDFGSGIHWIIILVVALLLFGRRLPEIMKGLGGSIREFKKGMDTDDKTTLPPPPVTPAAPTPEGTVNRPTDHSPNGGEHPGEPPKPH
jgi:TatA/E family protein of Tat protein translocase